MESERDDPRRQSSDLTAGSEHRRERARHGRWIALTEDFGYSIKCVVPEADLD